MNNRIAINMIQSYSCSTQTGAHRAHNPPGRATGPMHALVSCALLERRLELYFGRREAYIPKKNRVKISAQSELRISRNIKNDFWPDLRTQNRKEQRGRSNLGGAPAPPPPWRPWTRGKTLLPSRGRPRKKKEGSSLPLSPGGARTLSVLGS